MTSLRISFKSVANRCITKLWQFQGLV
jgi:hypothetical protein